MQDAPEKKRQVLSFLGLAGYHRKFLHDYTEAEDMLGGAPVLRIPDFDKPFIVQADVSDIGIDAVLLQEHPE